jgi:hypothetical protein
MLAIIVCHLYEQQEGLCCSRMGRCMLCMSDEPCVWRLGMVCGCVLIECMQHVHVSTMVSSHK